MTIGRLSIDTPYLGFYYSSAVCGCKILECPIGSFTWHGLECVCQVCEQYVCKCYGNEPLDGPKEE